MANVTVIGAPAFRLHVNTTSYDSFKSQVSQLASPVIYVRVVSSDDFRISAISADTDGFCMSFDSPVNTPKPTTFEADFPVIRYSGENSVVINGQMSPL